MMECLCADQYGLPKDVLQFQTFNELPSPTSDTEILIQIAYSDLNPVDIQKLAGSSNSNSNSNSDSNVIPNGPMIPGYGGSGIIQQIGKDVPREYLFKGMRVIFIRDPNRISNGSYATHLWVDYRLVSAIPTESIVTLQDAATIPIAGCTAYEALVKIGLGPNTNVQMNDNNNTETNTTRTSIYHHHHQQQQQQKQSEQQQQQKRKTLLVVGGAGGVGSWIILLANAWNNNCQQQQHQDSLTIIATVSTIESKRWCLDDIKAHHVITDHYKISMECNPSSITHIICLTEPTPNILEQLSEVIVPYGKICFVVAGASIKSLDLSLCFYKSVTILFESVFNSIRTNFTMIDPSKEMADIIQLIKSKQISKIPLSPQLSLVNSYWKDALKEEKNIFDLLASGHIQGKLVLKIKE